jgi:hypothetical protein
MIANARQILHPPSPNQDHRVFLQRVSLSWDIRGNFHAVAQTNPSDLAQSGIGFLWCGRPYLSAHPPLLRRSHAPPGPTIESVVGIPQSRRRTLLPLPLSSLPHQLIDGWQFVSPTSVSEPLQPLRLNVAPQHQATPPQREGPPTTTRNKNCCSLCSVPSHIRRGQHRRCPLLQGPKRDH